MLYTSNLQAYKLTFDYRTRREPGDSNASHLRCGHLDDTTEPSQDISDRTTANSLASNASSQYATQPKASRWRIERD